MASARQESDDCLPSDAMAAIASGASVDDALGTICASIQRRLVLDVCKVDLLTEDGAALQTIAQSTARPEWACFELGARSALDARPLAAATIREETPYFCDDPSRASADARSVGQQDDQLEVRGICLAPLAAKGKPLGLLCALHIESTPQYDQGFREAFIAASQCTANALRCCGLRDLAAESEKWFRRLIESSGNLVLTWTQKGTVTYASPAAQRIWGVREGAAVTDLLERVHADDQEVTRENLARAEKAPGPLRFDNRIVSPSKAEHRILWNISAVRDRNGRLTRLQGIGHDVTEWFDLEQRLRGAQYSESVVRLAGGFAHELNNMLVSVLGNATVLLGQLQPDHRWHPILSEIIDGAERAAKLTRQLLTYARATSYTPQRRRLGDLLNEHLELDRTVVPAAIDLNVHLDAEDDWIEADPMQLQQVVIGLISNAVEAMPDGGIVTVRSSRADADGPNGASTSGWLLLSVEDTGVGIPPEDREKIFDPFFSTKEMGRGLGLAAIQGIVQAHRGRIEIESRPGRGTKACVYLPLAQEA